METPKENKGAGHRERGIPTHASNEHRMQECESKSLRSAAVVTVVALDVLCNTSGLFVVIDYAVSKRTAIVASKCLRSAIGNAEQFRAHIVYLFKIEPSCDLYHQHNARPNGAESGSCVSRFSSTLAAHGRLVDNNDRSAVVGSLDWSSSGQTRNVHGVVRVPRENPRLGHSRDAISVIEESGRDLEGRDFHRAPAPVPRKREARRRLVLLFLQTRSCRTR